jgi:hypothetical protein
MVITEGDFMTKITVKPDCGNAPRKLFLKDFNIAWVEGDTASMLENIDKDVEWELVGDKPLRGKADFSDMLEKLVNKEVDELIISNIITHGKEAAVNGIRKLANGKEFSFCDVYTFQGAKGNMIKTITSYVIELKPNAK